MSTDIHKKKRNKNLVLLALILGWCALIWLVTMTRLAHGQEFTPEKRPFPSQRHRHQAVMDQHGADMQANGKIHQQAMDQHSADMLANGKIHQQAMDQHSADMLANGKIHQQAMDAADVLP